MSHECFADEIAIDFPSVGRVVERMRDAFLGEHVDGDVLRADVSVSAREAQDGGVVSLNVPVRVTCPNCGGRGETWTERCDLCGGTGQSTVDHPLRLTFPPRVADGACFRFRVKSPDAIEVRVEVRVAVRSSAA
jgi:DnaJ-class molecular chaperone